MIALIIFIASFIGLAFLVFKKISVLAGLPEQVEQLTENQKPIKQNILEKTNLIKQAVFNNRGVGVVGAVMVKTSGKFKTMFANRVVTLQDEHYWQKVETHNLPTKKSASKQSQSKIEIIQASATKIIETPETESHSKKPRTRKKKAE